MKGRGLVHDLVLERYRLGELEESRAAALRDRIAVDGALREQLSALEESDAEILAAFPPGPFAEAVKRRWVADQGAAANAPARGARPPLLRTAPALALGLALAVGLTFLLRGSLPGRGGTAATEATGDRRKGGSPDLVLYRKGRELAIERLSPGAVAHPLDVVQIAYQAGGRRYGVIVSIDGRGVVTRHLPASGDQAAPLQSGGAVALATAYRLDDAPRQERFYFVASDQPFGVSAVVGLASRAGLDPSADRLPLGGEFAQASFLLRKEGHP